jgi:predicted amidohydrolase
MLATNHAQLLAVLEVLAALNVDAVVTPECFLDGYAAAGLAGDSTELRKYAIDPKRSAYTASLAAWAEAARSWLLIGCSRISAAGVHNSCLVFNRQGELSAIYDKIHCQKHDLKFVPGNALTVFDSDFGPFGVMICADRRWPETVRSLALQGARIIFNPTYGMHDERNLQMMRTRSYESEVFIAFTHPLQSLLTGPGGDVISDATDPQLPYNLCSADLSVADRMRSDAAAHLRDRRPDLYTL